MLRQCGVLADISLTSKELDQDQLRERRDVGARAAERGVPIRSVIDLYLSATWMAWPSLPGVRQANGADWRLLADVDPVIRQPALMIYGDRDAVLRSERLTEFVPNVEVASLDCGHWIQQEKPDETNQAILKWLDQRAAVQGVSGKWVRAIR